MSGWSLEILNTPNESGELFVVAGNTVDIEFTVEDHDDGLTKTDTLELYFVDSGELISPRKRGSDLTGIVSLTTAQQYNGSYVAVRYMHEDLPVEDTSEHPILILLDQSAKILFDRLTDLEQKLIAANNNISSLQNIADEQATDIKELSTRIRDLRTLFNHHRNDASAHHSPYSDSDVEGYLLANGIDW